VDGEPIQRRSGKSGSVERAKSQLAFSNKQKEKQGKTLIISTDETS
jgi:hypothetical protein